MFLVTNFFSVFIPFWGMLGLWTTRIGYHHRVRTGKATLHTSGLTSLQWEFYFYNIIFGLFQAPYYAVSSPTSHSTNVILINSVQQYAQTMISELMPRGYDNMFFALFGITNRAVRATPHLLIPTNKTTVLYYRSQRHPGDHQRH